MVVFLGKPRADHAAHAKESPLVMTLPLVILAVPAVIAGYPWFIGHFFDIPYAEAPAIAHKIVLGFLAAGAVLAALLYLRGPAKDPVRIPLFANRLYIDNFYNWLVARVQGGLAVLGSWFDRWIIDGLIVTGSARTVWATGYVLRLLQLGNLQAYAFFFGAGVLLVLYFLVFR
jgi:NADH-quinone oxidoreductase subunit L